MDLQGKLNQVSNKLPSIVNAHAVVTIARQAVKYAESLKSKVTDQECLSEINNVILELKKADDLLLRFDGSSYTNFTSFDSIKYKDLSTYVYNNLEGLIRIKNVYYL